MRRSSDFNFIYFDRASVAVLTGSSGSLCSVCSLCAGEVLGAGKGAGAGVTDTVMLDMRCSRRRVERVTRARAPQLPVADIHLFSRGPTGRKST